MELTFLHSFCGISPYPLTVAMILMIPNYQNSLFLKIFPHIEQEAKITKRVGDAEFDILSDFKVRLFREAANMLICSNN